MTQHFLYSPAAGTLIEVRRDEIASMRSLDAIYWSRAQSEHNPKPLSGLKNWTRRQLEYGKAAAAERGKGAGA
jgi:hypothetical protein